MALAFAYDGTRFDSFARQPGKRTVEGELRRVLGAHGILGDAARARLDTASRTDAMVSAVWNVCAFDSTRDPRMIAHVDHDVDGLWLLSAARAPPGFSPRREALLKRYLYHVVAPGSLDGEAMKVAARHFTGQHDFRNFCRPDRGVPTRRTLERVDVVEKGFRFEARNFLWEQVRRISAALLDAGRDPATLERTKRRLARPDRADPQAPAPPQALVLEHVAVPLSFPAISKAMAARLARVRQESALRLRFYEGLGSAPMERR